jgi:translation initiation factor 5A
VLPLLDSFIRQTFANYHSLM